MLDEMVIFKNMDEIEEFVQAASKCECEVDVYYNHILLDGKSVLGLTGAGLGKELTVKCSAPTEEFIQIVEKRKYSE